MIGTLLSAFLTALGDLTDPRVRRVLGHSLLWTLAAFLGLGGLILWGIASLDLSLGSLSGFWLNAVVVWVVDLVAVALAGFVVAVLVWLLFAAIVQLVAGFYLDEVVDAVETRRYPGAPRAASPALTTAVAASLRLAGLMVLLNVLASPLYLFPGLNLAVFYALNGYLLGREYFELVALRRLDRRAARALRLANRGSMFLAGVVIVGLFSLPLVNLIAPFVGAAFMVHLVHAVMGREGESG